MQAMNVLSDEHLAEQPAPLKVFTNQELEEQPEQIKKVMTRLGVVFEPSQGMRWNLWLIYHAVLWRNQYFHELQTLLALYPNEPCDAEEEPAAAATVRERINARVADWLGIGVEPLTGSQLLQLRRMFVDERLGLGASPYRESNGW